MAGGLLTQIEILEKRVERPTIGVWEYCAKSKLHPASAGLEALTGRTARFGCYPGPKRQGYRLFAQHCFSKTSQSGTRRATEWVQVHREIQFCHLFRQPPDHNAVPDLPPIRRAKCLLRTGLPTNHKSPITFSLPPLREILIRVHSRPFAVKILLCKQGFKFVIGNKQALSTLDAPTEVA